MSGSEKLRSMKRQWWDILKFEDGVAVSACNYDAIIIDKVTQPYPLIFDGKLPETVLLLAVGRNPVDVIDHPIVRNRYGPNDVVQSAEWDDEAQVTVFDVRSFS